MFMMTFYFSRVTDLTYAKSAPVSSFWFYFIHNNVHCLPQLLHFCSLVGLLESIYQNNETNLISKLSTKSCMNLTINDLKTSFTSPSSFLSDEGPMLETLDHTIRMGSTPTFLYFDLYIYIYIYIFAAYMYVQ